MGDDAVSAAVFGVIDRLRQEIMGRLDRASDDQRKNLQEFRDEAKGDIDRLEEAINALGPKIAVLEDRAAAKAMTRAVIVSVLMGALAISANLLIAYLRG